MVVPRLGLPERPIAGPPKRFAQAVGVVFSAAAAILLLGLGLVTAGRIVLGVLVAFATLESVFGFCMGCTVFAGLMRAGVIPDEVCERCNDIWAGLDRPGARHAGPPMTATLPMAATGRRWAVAALVALGAGLIAAPAIFRMFDRAPKGATMIGSFKPYMSPARLDAYRRDIAQSRCRCSARVRSNNSSVRSSSTHCLLIE